MEPVIILITPKVYGIGTNNPIASLDISSMKNAMMIPVGNDTTEKPEGHPGMIRYNNEIYDYEGKGRNEWGTLGGIQDIDMNTKIELFAGLPTDDLATLTCITTDEIRFPYGVMVLVYNIMLQVLC